MASFHTTIPDPEELFVCPYDKVHMIRYKKMPYHLMKCRKNHLSQKMDVCPFNARHAVPEAEFRFHVSTCPDKHMVERQDERLMNDPDKISGNTDVPTYYPDIGMPEPEEDWDAEVVQPRIGVHPRDLAGVGYMKNLSGFKPSQKKAYYRNVTRGDTEANVRLVEQIDSFSPDNNDIAASAGDSHRVSNGIASPSPPGAEHVVIVKPAPKPVSTFAQPALGRGRGRLARKVLTPGVTPPPELAPSVNVTKLIRKLKKKIREAESLVERQANGESLNEEERVKVAMKTTMEYQLGKLEAGLET